MKNLEKEYEVHRYDIRTSEKKIFKKYSDVIKSHSDFDIRLEEYKTNQLIKIKEYSIQKIFSLINEFPEESILFLYLSEYKPQKSIPKKNIPILDTSDFNIQLNSSDVRLDINDLENPPSNPEIIKENKNPQYICIFSILYFIICGLLLIHLLQFVFSKEVSKNFEYNLFYFIACFLFLYYYLLFFNRNIRIPWLFT